jgi:hypothetical protein
MADYRKYYGKGYRSYGSKGYDNRQQNKNKRPETEEIKKSWIVDVQEKEGQKGKYLLVRTKKWSYYIPAEDELTINAIQDDEDHTFIATNGRLTVKAKDSINVTSTQYVAQSGTDNRPLVESRDPKEIEQGKGTREFRTADAITLINTALNYLEDIRNYLLSLEQTQQIYAQQQKAQIQTPQQETKTEKKVEKKKKEAKKEGESNDTESTEFSE